MNTPSLAVRDRILTLPPTELPAYVYDLAALRAHAASVRAALPSVSRCTTRPRPTRSRE